VGELIMAVAQRGRMAKTIDGMQRGRTKVFALEVRVSGKWGSNHDKCRLR